MTWDVRNKVCVVTGATSGIGRETAVALARRGANLVIVSRDATRLSALAEQLKADGAPDVCVVAADLSRRAGVKSASDTIAAARDRVDVLVNNAGAMFAHRELNEDGFESTWALNHLGYFRLTDALLPLLRASGNARVVSVSSDAHRGGTIRWQDPTLDGVAWLQGFPAYAQSKLANLLFAAELGRRLDGAGVISNSLHPGFVDTGFNRNNGRVIGAIMDLGSRLFARSAAKGAETVIWAATAEDAGSFTSRYLTDRRVVEPAAQGRSLEDAARLWALSAESL